jgi:hypothetical protein
MSRVTSSKEFKRREQWNERQRMSAIKKKKKNDEEDEQEYTIMEIHNPYVEARTIPIYRLVPTNTTRRPVFDSLPLLRFPTPAITTIHSSFDHHARPDDIDEDW